MMVSVIFCRLGLLPRSLMLWIKSGSKGTATPLPSCLSAARLLTFHRPNSLWVHNYLRETWYEPILEHNNQHISHYSHFHVALSSIWLFSTSVPLSMFVCSISIPKSSFGLNRAARMVGGISLFLGLKSLHREPGTQSEHISTKHWGCNPLRSSFKLCVVPVHLELCILVCWTR